MVAMKRRHTDLTVLVAGDWVAAAMAWALFFYYRKIYVVKDWFGDLHYTDLDMQLFTGLLTLPWVWVLLYALSGSYQDIYRKSRLNETGRLLFSVMVGGVILFLRSFWMIMFGITGFIYAASWCGRCCIPQSPG